MNKIISVTILFIFLLFIPIGCYAENDSFNTQYEAVQVRVVVPAIVVFQNEDIVIKQEIEIGQKLKEPSHIDINGYIFIGWYDGEHKWDFENDVVEDHLTLIAKYKALDNFRVNVTIDEKSIMQPSILNSADLEAEFLDNSYNNNVNIILELKDADNLIHESEKQKFEKVFKQKKLILGKYINLSLFMELDHDLTTRKEIHETKNKIKIQITIPKDMRFNNKKYYVLRLHDDIVETIYEGFPNKDGKLTFETDKFSLYAIAYSDDNYINPNNPITGDNISLWFVLMIISIICIIVYIRKKITSSRIKLLEEAK